MTVEISSPALQRFGPWADGRAKVRALVIVNEHAGSVGKGARERLLTAFSGMGGETIKIVSNLRKLSVDAATGADVIIVLGGDGTARRAAAMFAVGPPLLLLPGGTLNVLAHALCGAMSWPQVLEAALLRGRIMRLTGGEANGRKFFVAALFGAPTLLAGAREAVRRWRIGLAIARLGSIFSRPFSHRLAVRPDGGVVSRAEALGVLCPAYRGEIDGQSLEWVRLDSGHFLDLVRVSVRSLLGGWREDPAIERSMRESGEVRSSGLIPAILDGEPTAFFRRVDIRFVRDGPRVLIVD